uniref:hypothetical protein n=1 Tax=Raoultella planticola TaxID=575 RepID=UPI001C6FCBED
LISGVAIMNAAGWYWLTPLAEHPAFRPPCALYIPLLADTKHSLKPEKEKLIVISTAPQWG